MPELPLIDNCFENETAMLRTVNIIRMYMLYPENNSDSDNKREEGCDILDNWCELNLRKDLEDYRNKSILKGKIFIKDKQRYENLSNIIYDEISLPYYNFPKESAQRLEYISQASTTASQIENEFKSFKEGKNFYTIWNMIDILLKLLIHHKDAKGGVSIRKCRTMLETKVKKQKLNAQLWSNEKNILKCWQQFKSVSHYIYAYYIYFSYPITLDTLKLFLSRARFIQNELLRIDTLNHKNKKIFSTENLWTVPSWTYSFIYPIDFKIKDFDIEDMKIFKSYKSY